MMFPTAFLLLSLVSAVTSSYVNEFDKSFVKVCPQGMSIGYWESYHSNHYEDRRYKFSCQKTTQLSYCRWHDGNKFKAPLSFQCPRHGVIRGLSSHHDDRYEDRIFYFLCCYMPGRSYLAHCVKTDFVNNWDQRLTFRIPKGRFLRGVSSTYSNYYNDRRWKFETCAIQ